MDHFLLSGYVKILVLFSASLRAVVLLTWSLHRLVDRLRIIFLSTLSTTTCSRLRVYQGCLVVGEQVLQRKENIFTKVDFKVE